MSINKISSEKIRLIIGLVLAVFIPLFFGKMISLDIKMFSYNLSLSLKQVLLMVLPFVIFSFVSSCLLSFQTGVVRIVFLLVSCVFLSNLITIYFGYGVGNLSNYFFDMKESIHISDKSIMQAVWALDFPLFIENKHGLILGFLFGIFFTYKPNEKVKLFAKKCNKYAHKFLEKVFIPILPIFILGFIFKLEQDQLLGTALFALGPVFFVVVGAHFLWITLTYIVYNKFNFSKAFACMKNVLPATITGFSTISSAASLPVLILCSENNADPEIVDTVLPASINIHTLGSAIGVTVLAVTIAEMFNIHITFLDFVIFSFYYALAKFSVAAVPGGVIVVVTPLLEQYLGFTPGMTGLITAMYMLFDPFGTAANVTGNGSFVIMFDKLLKKFNLK